MNVRLNHIGEELVPELKSLQSKLLMAGGVGAAVCAIGLVMNPAQFVRSFLPAYLWLLSVTLGALGLAMVHQVSGGAWGVVIRRILGAATRTLPLLTILFIPIALGLHSLYPWADAAHVADDHSCLGSDIRQSGDLCPRVVADPEVVRRRVDVGEARAPVGFDMALELAEVGDGRASWSVRVMRARPAWSTLDGAVAAGEPKHVLDGAPRPDLVAAGGAVVVAVHGIRQHQRAGGLAGRRKVDGADPRDGGGGRPRGGCDGRAGRGVGAGVCPRETAKPTAATSTRAAAPPPRSTRRSGRSWGGGGSGGRPVRGRQPSIRRRVAGTSGARGAAVGAGAAAEGSAVGRTCSSSAVTSASSGRSAARCSRIGTAVEVASAASAPRAAA